MSRGTPVHELSVVVPVYGCAGCLRALHERVTRAVQEITDSYEIILVDDRSPDASWEILQEITARDPRTTAYRLSRNFGQHATITAGLAQSRGRWVVVMDCDLQDPPEEIPRLYAKAQEGHEVVFGRRARKELPWFRRVAARGYFRLMNAFTGAGLDGSFGTFSILSAPVVEAFLGFKDRDRHYLFILNWLGYDRASMDYAHAPRAEGKSSYSLPRLIRHALDGMFFQTTVLLRLIVYIGFALCVLGLGLAVYFLFAKLSGTGYPGWTSLAIFTLTIGGFMILSTGVTGLYIGKVFEQVKGRPLYVIDRRTDSAAPVGDEERPPRAVT